MVANEGAASVYEVSAKYRDIIFALPDLSLESPKALHVHPPL
jgi:hypothetical protein